MSLDAALARATSGLRHTTRQIEVTSQNVANAGVEGYTRKTAAGQQSAAAGVRTLEIQRDVDLGLQAEARAARGEAAAAQLRSDTLAPLAQLQGNPSDGSSLGGLVGALRDEFTQLRAGPDDSAAQAETLRSAGTLVDRLGEVAGAVARSRQTVQDGLRTDVDAANGLLRDIARLDARVKAERAAGRNGADTLDQRDAALGRLSELLDITPVQNGDGGLTLVLRGGAILPLDPEGSPLGLEDALTAPGAYHGAPAGTLPGLTLNGVALSDVPRGGRIGEGMVLRDEILAGMGAELDTLATTLAGRLSEQGLTLFTEPGGGAPPATGSAAAPGFALRITVSPQVQSEPATLRDGTPGTPAFPPNPDGQSGYTALLDRVLNFAFGDERAAGTAHAAIPGSGLGPGGDLSSDFAPPRRLADYAAAVTASHAAEAGAAATAATASAGNATQLASLVQARQGVDVDQEMAGMVTLQNAYAANARIMSVVQSMWDALLAAVR